MAIPLLLLYSNFHIPSHTANTATAGFVLRRDRPARLIPFCRGPFSVGYGLWPFDDLSLSKPILTEEGHRKDCVQHRDSCCSCGSTEYSLRWCTALFQTIVSLLNTEFATHDPDGAVFETKNIKIRNRRRVGP